MKTKPFFIVLIPFIIVALSGMLWVLSAPTPKLKPTNYHIDIELKQDLDADSYLNCYSCVIHLNGRLFHVNGWLYNYGTIKR